MKITCPHQLTFKHKDIKKIAEMTGHSERVVSSWTRRTSKKLHEHHAEFIGAYILLNKDVIARQKELEDLFGSI